MVFPAGRVVGYGQKAGAKDRAMGAIRRKCSPIDSAVLLFAQRMKLIITDNQYLTAREFSLVSSLTVM